MSRISYDAWGLRATTIDSFLPGMHRLRQSPSEISAAWQALSFSADLWQADYVPWRLFFDPKLVRACVDLGVQANRRGLTIDWDDAMRIIVDHSKKDHKDDALNSKREVVSETVAGTTADLAGVTLEMPLARCKATPAEARPHSHARTLFNQGDLIQGIFRVENVLAGGMGVVYICRQPRYEELSQSYRAPFSPSAETDSANMSADTSPRYQVFKSFRRELLFQGDVSERFNHEALLWVTLRPHPNIVRARSFERATPLLRLDYVDGGDLSARLGKPLAPQEIARIGIQFCSGMIFLFESAGIVHRDIKPANILLTRDGTVKITDFGLAKAFSSPQTTRLDSFGTDTGPTDTSFATECGKVMGSLPWMSPEQFMAPDKVTTTSDVYSFGVVLYEMLTGRMPYDASNAEEWTRKVLQEIPVSPEIASGADEEVSAIVMKCLEKQPSHRFRDFVELRAALERWAVRNEWSMWFRAVTFAQLESAMTATDWSNRGYSFGQLGRYEDSYQCYLRAMDLDSTCFGIHSNIGSALIRLGRFKEGLQHHQRETELNPTRHSPGIRLRSIIFSANVSPRHLRPVGRRRNWRRIRAFALFKAVRSKGSIAFGKGSIVSLSGHLGYGDVSRW